MALVGSHSSATAAKASENAAKVSEQTATEAANTVMAKPPFPPLLPV